MSIYNIHSIKTYKKLSINISLIDSRQVDSIKCKFHQVNLIKGVSRSAQRALVY